MTDIYAEGDWRYATPEERRLRATLRRRAASSPRPSARGEGKRLVYVAGPYSAPTAEGRLANVRAAMRAGYEILRRGHAPLIPHLNHWFDQWHGEAFGEVPEAEYYMEWDFALLRRCDALLFLGPSPGANRELDLAWELGIPVYRSVNDLNDE